MKAGSAWYLKDNSVVEPMGSCTEHSAYARRAAALLPRYSAWSPFVSLGGRKALLIAVASKLTVSVFLYSPDEDVHTFSFASFFNHKKLDVNVTSIAFSVCSKTTNAKVGYTDPPCDIENLRLAIGFSDGSLVLYNATVNPVTLNTASVHDVKLSFAESLHIGHPCRRHVTSLCPFESVHDDVISDVTKQRCRYIAFSRARSLCVWDEATGHVCCVPSAHPEAITALTYSHVKRQLYTSSIDGTVRSWTVSRKGVGEQGAQNVGVPQLEGGDCVYCGKSPVMGIDTSASGALLFVLVSNRGAMRKTTFEKRLTSTCFGMALPIQQLVSDLKERIFARLNGSFGFVDFCAAVFGIYEQSEKYADELCSSLIGSGSDKIEEENLSKLQFAYAICSLMVSSGNEDFRGRYEDVGKRIAIVQSEFINAVSGNMLVKDKDMVLSEKEELALKLHGKTKEILLSDGSKCDMGEKCFVCGERILFDSIKVGVCLKGHAFRRCAVTRLLVKPSASEPMACCSGCGSDSVSLNSGSFRVFRNSMFWSCPFCVSPFTLT